MTTPAPRRPAVFLDRDGTMIHDVGYLSRREDVTWYPWTIEAMRLLRRAEFELVVVTNQGGIGLGFCTEAFVRSLHDEFDRALAAAGADVAAWMFCPHHPRARIEALRVPCECRKPGPGMIREAAQRLAIDVSRSYVIGDKAIDLALAQAVGAQGILVKTGYGRAEAGRHDGRVPGAVFVAETLMEATAWILEQQAAAGEQRT
jgi:D-glycero-D-manno-heptose 1,7-bisphosphate phosphatase